MLVLAHKINIMIVPHAFGLIKESGRLLELSLESPRTCALRFHPFRGFFLPSALLMRAFDVA